jgi:DDE superfamily endonuclease
MYAPRGSRTVAIKGATTSSRCTVMVETNLAGDIKLPTMVIFAGSSGRTGRVKREVESNVEYPVDMEYRTQNNAWRDEEQMLQWVEKV